MSNAAVPLFYSYDHEDETLRDQLDKPLSLLKRQGTISDWYDRDITAGSVRAEEVERRLRAARVILLLVSPAFIASDYCYGVEMQVAMQRHVAGEATVIPIICAPAIGRWLPSARYRLCRRTQKLLQCGPIAMPRLPISLKVFAGWSIR